MKKTIYLSVIMAAVMLLLPLGALEKGVQTKPVAALTVIPDAEQAATDTVRLCDTETDKLTELKTEDYLFGVVAAEMPALYEVEALKAQTVAAYTYTCFRKAENADKSYDITTDSTCDQSYITEEAAKQRWGEKAEEYTKKIKEIIAEVSGYMVLWEGKPALTVYHAISSGKTEDGQNVWGTGYPYLKPVSSEGDRLSDDYISQVSFTAAELEKKLSSEIPLSGDKTEWFGKAELTQSGTVTEIELCGEKVKGARIRSLLDLRSSAFEVELSDNTFTFTVYGYGHFVGMSQNGANYMAKQGSDFKEILTHYYKGCTVEKIK
ncbi:MAG: stage II sporulation protein D [Clostridia bacterium]|nr:stage II sporulation protein D [Clostridia bacterium]